MFAATVLGIGVDYAIHLVHRAKAASRDGETNWEATLVSAAPPLLLDVLAIGIAFAILALSQVPANALLGVCIALSLVVCAFVTLALLPTCIGQSDLRKRKISTC